MANDRDEQARYEKERDAYDDRWRNWLRGSSTGMDIDGRCIHPDSTDYDEREEC